MAFIMTNDGKLAAAVSRMDNVVDRLTEAIKRYVRQVDTRVPDKPEGPRAMEIVSFASNLEHFGDIIDKKIFASWRSRRGPMSARDIEFATMADELLSMHSA